MKDQIKLEAVRKAWGDQWSERVGEYGWCDFGKNHSYDTDSFDTIKYLDCVSIRPKSLRDIENNNGWTRINNKSDIPEETGEYFVLLDFEESKEIHSVVMRSVADWFGVTHYQKIVKPSLPVY